MVNDRQVDALFGRMFDELDELRKQVSETQKQVAVVVERVAHLQQAIQPFSNTAAAVQQMTGAQRVKAAAMSAVLMIGCSVLGAIAGTWWQTRGPH